MRRAHDRRVRWRIQRFPDGPLVRSPHHHVSTSLPAIAEGLSPSKIRGPAGRSWEYSNRITWGRMVQGGVWGLAAGTGEAVGRRGWYRDYTFNVNSDDILRSDGNTIT